MNVPVYFKDKNNIRRVFNVIFSVMIGVAFAGFVVGVNEEHTPIQPEITHKPMAFHSEQAIPAVGYAEMNARKRGVNKNWSSRLDSLESQVPNLLDPVEKASEAEKLDSLALRESLRAYDGAPPVIPHRIDQRFTANCLACHGQEMTVGERVVPKISHPPYANCTQCHVEMENSHLTFPFDVENTFAGAKSPSEGKRAWPGAPPVVPHQTHMRDDCRSCHGLTGRPGLRTTHPERANCLQCHGPSANFDQLPGLPPAFISQPIGGSQS